MGIISYKPTLTKSVGRTRNIRGPEYPFGAFEWMFEQTNGAGYQ